MNRAHMRTRISGATPSIVAAGVVVACASVPNANETTSIYTSANAYDDFAGSPGGAPNAGVQGMLAAKCATLDCHGEVGRSLRIFSQNGLRIADDSGNVPGVQATTPEEIFANFTSTISWPRRTSKVFANQDDPHVLILLRKPLGLERHKGGQVLASGDPGDVCLTSWLEDGWPTARARSRSTTPRATKRRSSRAAAMKALERQSGDRLGGEEASAQGALRRRQFFALYWIPIRESLACSVSGHGHRHSNPRAREGPRRNLASRSRT